MIVISGFVVSDEKEARKLMASVKLRLGSFYLRVGAVAFGIGSMVYSGLEFGQYFELEGVTAIACREF